MHYFHPQKIALDRSPTPINPFPPVDTARLHVSAQRFKELMQQANLLIEKIANSDEFAHQLMHEAQLSNTKKVEELIISAGITLKVNTSFTPTGIRIELDNSENQGGCCKLLMSLHW